MNAFLSFLGFFVSSIALLAVFTFVYEKFTPYREFQEIKKNNIAAAITLSGALLGFTFPVLSAIFFTHSYLEMIKWAAITGVVQLAWFTCIRGYASNDIIDGKVAPAIFVAFASIAVGLLNAVCISY